MSPTWFPLSNSVIISGTSGAHGLLRLWDLLFGLSGVFLAANHCLFSALLCWRFHHEPFFEKKTWRLHCYMTITPKHSSFKHQKVFVISCPVLVFVLPIDLKVAFLSGPNSGFSYGHLMCCLSYSLSWDCKDCHCGRLILRVSIPGIKFRKCLEYTSPLVLLISICT